MKKSGFTLAEVLITLSIIGIVAAMTIPNLSSSKNKQVYITGAKKAYATLSEAYNRSIIDNDTIDNWSLSTSASPEGANNILQNLAPYLKVVENCGVSGTSCMDYDTKHLNSTDWAVNTTGACARAILADGSVITTYSYGGCPSVGGAHNACGEMCVDINGEQKPNTLGKDIFVFYIATDFGILPAGFPDDSLFHPYTTHCNTDSAAGYACTYQVVVKGNMDYLD